MKYKLMTILVLTLAAIFVFTACTPKAPVVEKEMAQEESMTDENIHDDPLVAEEEMTDEGSEDAIMSEYEIYTLDGVRVDPLGEKTYIKLWASWCSVCLSGLGEVDELFAMDTDFRVMTVVVPGEYGELSEEDFKAWWEGLQSEYPNVEVLVDRNGDFFRAMGVRAFPTSAYIGSDGKLSETVIGHNANGMILDKMMDK